MVRGFGRFAGCRRDMRTSLAKPHGICTLQAWDFEGCQRKIAQNAAQVMVRFDLNAGAERLILAPLAGSKHPYPLPPRRGVIDDIYPGQESMNRGPSDRVIRVPGEDGREGGADAVAARDCGPGEGCGRGSESIDAGRKLVDS